MLGMPRLILWGTKPASQLVNVGKVAAIRHPVNDYRLSDGTDLKTC